jgi:hypothetical protein
VDRARDVGDRHGRVERRRVRLRLAGTAEEDPHEAGQPPDVLAERLEQLVVEDGHRHDLEPRDGRGEALDGLAELADRRRVEAEADRFLRRRSYLQPFALRALGRVREDDRLIADAAERFADLGLDWHASETRALLST